MKRPEDQIFIETLFNSYATHRERHGSTIRFRLPIGITEKGDSVEINESDDSDMNTMAVIAEIKSNSVSVSYSKKTHLNHNNFPNTWELKEWLEDFAELREGYYKTLHNESNVLVQSYNDGFLYRLNSNISISKVPDEDITMLDIQKKYNTLAEIPNIDETGDILAILESNRSGSEQYSGFSMYLFENVCIIVTHDNHTQNHPRINITPLPAREIAENSLLSDNVLAMVEPIWVNEDELDSKRLTLDKL